MGKKKGKKAEATTKVDPEVEEDEGDNNNNEDGGDATTKDEDVANDAEGGSDSKPKTRGQLIQAHKREQKDLKTKTNAMLHSFNKNDKKAKKQTMDTIKKLEDELKAKQDAELAAFDANEKKTTETPSSTSSSSTPTTTTASTAASTTTTTPAPAKPTVGKSQKKKAKKAAKSAALLSQIEKEKKNTVSQRQIELDQLKKRLLPLNLIIHEIAADGDCLYNSVLHQVKEVQPQSVETCAELRRKVGQFMRGNSNDFLPFFDAESEDDLPREFEEYCNKVATTSSWGGQLELKAIAQLLNQHIIVHTAAGPDIEMGEDFKGLSPPLHLTYHKHYFTLGEHYNSAITKPPTSDDDGDGETTTSS